MKPNHRPINYRSADDILAYVNSIRVGAEKRKLTAKEREYQLALMAVESHKARSHGFVRAIPLGGPADLQIRIGSPDDFSVQSPHG